MYSFFIGCDMSKDVFDTSFILNGQAVYLGQFVNNKIGFKRMLKQLAKQTDVDQSKWFVCFENTGVYSKQFLEWLLVNQIPCREENALAIHRSLGIRRGKDDQIDSEAICLYAFEKRDSLKPSTPTSKVIYSIKQLLSRRKLLVRQMNALKVSLNEQKIFMDDELMEQMQQSNELLLKEYKRQIADLEQQMELLVEQDEELQQNHQLAQSVVGIGSLSSLMIIANTNNFKRIVTARKFACYCGVAPFPNQSGKRIGRSKVSHMANKELKTLLYNASMSAIKYDPQIRSYFKRKKAEGKQGFVVMNAVKNKLIQRVFAVIERQKPYVKLSHIG